MFDWNDLKYFLAVAQHKSTIAAGRELSVSQTTVQRRLSELEKRLDRKLVSRHPEGYRLTDEGEALLPFAERMGVAAADLERHIKEKASDITGTVRVTFPEPIVHMLLKSDLIGRFNAVYPNIAVQFITNDRYLDILKGEADIALRSGDTDEELVGRKVGESVWAVFASKNYIAMHGRPNTLDDLDSHAFVAFDAAHVPHRSIEWMKRVAPNARIVSSHNSVLGLVSGVKSGVGLGAIPKPLGNRDADLVCVLDSIPELQRDWRILAHPDLRHTPRIAAFFDFMVENRAELSAILNA
jgi:DNA-binding transcriptional LysR family regulator